MDPERMEIMKKYRLWAVLLVMVMVITAGCSKAPESTKGDPEEDWRDGEYIYLTWSDSEASVVYYAEVDKAGGAIVLYADEADQRVVTTLNLYERKAYDVDSIKTTLRMTDVDGDGYDDITCTDFVDGEFITLEYFYEPADKIFITDPQVAYDVNDSGNNDDPGDEPSGYTEEDAPYTFGLYSSVINDMANEYHDNCYYLWDIDEDGVVELLIESGEERTLDVWTGIDDGNGGLELHYAGVVPGSENGTLTVTDDGILVFEELFQGVHYLHILGMNNGELDDNVNDSWEEDEYNLCYTPLTFSPVTDLEELNYIY